MRSPIISPVLGVDPGSLTTGYAFVVETGRRLVVRDFGEISPPAKAPLPRRLLAIHDALESKILAHRPECLSLEALFVAKGLQSMMKLVYAKGVVLLLAARHNLDVFEYPALTVKKSVVGYGQAEKRQVQFMVRQLLSLADLPRPDEADAMALALCHLQARKARLLAGSTP
ncbi:MAG: crossover junction endodeoxyribonuclease RuvC [Nitrospirae bacterium]|nr:crossover junction endodeoxyribonuclease RuvC [Nitrospirota bacterium]